MLEQYLNSLSETEIKQLVHLYLGDKCATLNKPKLVSKLISFFTPDTVDTLLSSLTDDELLILSLIFIKKECDIKTLEMYTHLPQAVLLNQLYYLKIKLLVTETDAIYFLNPVFTPERIITYDKLFKSEKSATLNPLVDRNTIIGILNYFYANPSPAHGPHLEKYLRSSAFTSLFPRVSPEQIHDVGKFILRYLIDHEEISLEDGHYELCANCFLKYLKLNTISLISLFIFDSISEKTIMFLTLLSQIGLIERQNLESTIDTLYTLTELKERATLSNFFMFNLICETDAKLNINVSFEEKYSPFIQYNSDLSAYYQDQLSLDSILPLVANVEKVDTLSLYTVNKQCFTKALDYYSTFEELISMMSSDSSTLPDLVRSRLDSWYEAYSRISFVEGVVMYTDKQEASIIDSLPLLQIHIIKRLSPTVYLMKKETQGQWRRLLLYAGFENLSAIKTEKPQVVESAINYPFPKKANSSITKRTLPTSSLKSAEVLIKHNLLLTDEQVSTLTDREPYSVFPFDVKAKQVLLEQLLKQHGRDVLVSFTDHDIYAVVLDVYKENGIVLTKLFNLESHEVITTAVSKIYTLTLI